MKSCKLLSCLFAATVALSAFNHNAASAQTNAYDDAFHYTTVHNLVHQQRPGHLQRRLRLRPVGPDHQRHPARHGFFTTHNVGTAPTPTIASPTNYSSTNTPPVGSPPGNDNNQHVWGIFCNGTGLNTATAYRTFNNSLSTTVAFKIDWQTDGIGSGITNFAGFALRNGNPTNGPADYFTNMRFMFYFVGGGSNLFSYFDANGANHINIPFTSAGLACEFTLLANDMYRFVVKNATNSAILAVLDNQPLNPATGTTIDSVALFCSQTAGNQEFNFMQIVSTSLTPPTFANVAPANGSLYVGLAGTNISFEVDSLASTVSSNGLTVLLNGVAQTNLTVNTAGPTNMLLVSDNASLIPNTLYNYTIIAQDANGNLATNTGTFNTFLATDVYVDAADYNYNSGLFIDANRRIFTPICSGSNSIDYFDLIDTSSAPTTSQVIAREIYRKSCR